MSIVVTGSVGNFSLRWSSGLIDTSILRISLSKPKPSAATVTKDACILEGTHSIGTQKSPLRCFETKHTLQHRPCSGTCFKAPKNHTADMHVETTRTKCQGTFIMGGGSWKLCFYSSLLPPSCAQDPRPRNAARRTFCSWCALSATNANLAHSKLQGCPFWFLRMKGNSKDDD